MKDNIFLLLDEIINDIKKSNEYQHCLLLKDKIEKNQELLEQIDKIKMKQKEYVRGQFQNENIKQELSSLEKELNSIPIYLEYSQNLEIVNEKIAFLQEELNSYFVEKFNLLK